MRVCVYVCVYACTGVHVMRVRANSINWKKSQENFAEKILKFLLTRFSKLCIMYIVR